LCHPANGLARGEHLVHRAVTETCTPEGRLPHTLTQVRHVQRTTVAVREDPRRGNLAGAALGAERALDRWKHVDVARRPHGLCGPLAEATHSAANADRLPMPVEVLPLQAD